MENYKFCALAKFDHAGLKPVPPCSVSEANPIRTPEMHRNRFLMLSEKSRHHMPYKETAASTHNVELSPAKVSVVCRKYSKTHAGQTAAWIFLNST
jgi:hypothetical protein